MNSRWVAAVVCVAIAICSMQMDLAAAQQPDCTASIVSLAACLGYVQGEEPTPEPGCCTQLQNVGTSEPVCLCELLGYENSSSTPIPNLNVTLARMLPGLCNVTADESQCPELLGEAPAGSPLPLSFSGGPLPSIDSGSSNPASTLLPSISTCLHLAALTIVAPFLLFVN